MKYELCYVPMDTFKTQRTTYNSPDGRGVALQATGFPENGVCLCWNDNAGSFFVTDTPAKVIAFYDAFPNAACFNVFVFGSHKESLTYVSILMEVNVLVFSSGRG